MALANDLLAVAALGAWCLLAAGCGETAADRRERLERTVAAASLATERGRLSVAERGADIVRHVLELPPEGRAEAVADLAGLFRRLDFDERSYLSREDSMAAYARLVAAVADGLRGTSGVEGAVWRFRLAAADRVNAEIERCEREPNGGPYGDVSKIGVGPFMTQRQYLSFLKSRRFDIVYEGFEMGAGWFPQYFHALPPTKKEEWQTRLEKVAHRRVVVWNPDSPLAEMPRYEAEDTREWLPQKSPDEPRRYVEHLGGGRTMVIKETRWGVETRKRREAMRRQQQGESSDKEMPRTTNRVVRLNGGLTE